ncbi:MAG: SPOR domain-containing protein [Candidatus Aminicenantes bacterium]
MKIKFFLNMFILCFLFMGYFNKVLAEHYSIQVKSFPMNEKSGAFQFYNDLKDAGYFVYMHKTKIERNWWIRIKIGYFNSKDKADLFGKEIKSKSSLDYWVNPANILIDRSNANYKILTTPSGIWLEKNSSFEEVYSFLPQMYHAGILLETKAIASSVSDEIVFYFQKKLIKVNLKSKESVILKEAQIIEELHRSSPKWSYDGRYIAYMDSYTWEVPTKLQIMRNDGTHDTCIVQDISRQNKVKDFSWHPSKNELFYIYGYTYGSMDLGGDLYVISIDSLKSRMIVTTENRNRFLLEKINIVKNGINLTIMQLKDGAPLKQRIYKKIPLPDRSTLIKLKEQDLQKGAR